MKSSAHSSDNALAQWYQNEPGRSLAQREHDVVSNVMRSLPGTHVVQAGALNGEPIRFFRAQSSYCHLALDQSDTKYGHVCADSSAFPLRTEMTDVVLLLHSLEFSPNPRQLLGEAERILRPGGHLIVLGFNPLSLFGLTHLLRFSGLTNLNHGAFLTRRRLKDWCTTINLEVIGEHSGYYGLPLTSIYPLAWHNRLVQFSDRFFPWAGAFYVLLIRKRLFPLTPMGVKATRGVDALMPKPISTSRTSSHD